MHQKLADGALAVERATAVITGAAGERRRYWANTGIRAMRTTK
jgi:hypothetical protein